MRRLLHLLLRLSRLATTLERVDAPGEVRVILVSAAQIARLNRRFLNHAGDTDVIAFRYPAPPPVFAAAAETPVLGELYVCPEVAVRAARRYSTTPARELTLYLVHGFLHLAGEDDVEPRARQRMKRKERRLVRQLCAVAEPETVFEFPADDPPAG